MEDLALLQNMVTSTQRLLNSLTEFNWKKAWKQLSSLPNFFFDVLYVHDKASKENKPQVIQMRQRRKSLMLLT